MRLHLQVLVQAGGYVKEEVVRALVVLVSNTPALQAYVARTCMRTLDANLSRMDAALAMFCCWCVGEYADAGLAGAAP